MAATDVRRVSIHGHEISYRDVGEGPVLLLLHGIAGSSRAWREIMPALAGEYRLIAPDLLGHGESAKPLGDYSLGAYASGLRDFLGVLGVERVTLVGQSFGGGVAMQLAYQHPAVASGARSAPSCGRRPCRWPSTCCPSSSPPSCGTGVTP